MTRDAPHDVTGAPFQTRSVAEMMRAWRLLHPHDPDGVRHR
jgi:hypothetical protein